MYIPQAWKDLSTKIAEVPGIIFVIGASDTGKTTLAKYLLKEWTHQGLSVAFVDCDMGQSTLGPPGTIGMSVFGRCVQDVNIIHHTKEISLFFIGSFSPIGHLLQTIVGVKEMVQRAQFHKPDLILVDTTGLVFGGVGEHLKYRKVQLLQPRHVILIQKAGELEHLKNRIQSKERYIYNLEPSSQIKLRTPEVRRNYRIQQLKEYFKEAEVRRIDFPKNILWGFGHFGGLPLKDEDLHFCSQILEGRILYGEKGGQTLFLLRKDFVSFRHKDTLKAKYKVANIIIYDVQKFENLLVAFYNSTREIVSIGVVKRWDFEQRNIEVFAHIENLGEIEYMEIGKETVDFFQ